MGVDASPLQERAGDETPMRARHRGECMCVRSLLCTAAPRTLGSSRPQRTSTLHVRYALFMNHPKEGKTSDAQPQLRLRLNEVLPRRTNPQPRNPKKKEPHSPILGVLSSPPDGRSHPRRLSVVARLRRRIGPFLRARRKKFVSVAAPTRIGRRTHGDTPGRSNRALAPVSSPHLYLLPPPLLPCNRFGGCVRAGQAARRKILATGCTTALVSLPPPPPPPH
jgi:hypothetical protein